MMNKSIQRLLSSCVMVMWLSHPTVANADMIVSSQQANSITRSALATKPSSTVASKPVLPHTLQRKPTLDSQHGRAIPMSPNMSLTPAAGVDTSPPESNMPGANQPTDIGYAAPTLLRQKTRPGATPGMGQGSALLPQKNTPPQGDIPVSTPTE